MIQALILLLLVPDVLPYRGFVPTSLPLSADLLGLPFERLTLSP